MRTTSLWDVKRIVPRFSNWILIFTMTRFTRVTKESSGPGVAVQPSRAGVTVARTNDGR